MQVLESVGFPIFGFGDLVFVSRNGVVFTLEKALFAEVLGKGRCFFFGGWVGLGSVMNNDKESFRGKLGCDSYSRFFLGSKYIDSEQISKSMKMTNQLVGLNNYRTRL